MRITLKVWRQDGPDQKGRFETHQTTASPDMSFLEMLDVLNDRLQEDQKIAVSFDSDCREGICGMCGLVINGIPHGPGTGTTTCQLYMRSFADGDTITVEPFRAAAFPVIRDLVVDRSAFDTIIQAGGYNSINTGSAPDANAVLVSKEHADAAMDAAACIGCGACVATCKNASAMLFVAAKVKHLNILPQGQPERLQRSRAMLQAMDDSGFGHCTNEYECEAVCPKEISVGQIAFLNREVYRSTLAGSGLAPVVTGK